MMLREVQALVMLYRACVDPVVRMRAVELVPDLADFDVDPPNAWRIQAYHHETLVVTATRLAVCTEKQLEQVIAAFSKELDDPDLRFKLELAVE